MPSVSDICPDEVALHELVAGALDTERAAALRQHIARCEDCRKTVAALASSTESIETKSDPERYELRRLLATGGMGEVFLAHDTVLARDVALKFLREDAAERVVREARTLASLAHPNVVAVHDQGILDGRPFLAMEYVAGRTLRQWIAEDVPPKPRIVEMLRQGGEGLAAAHELGIVHGDVKPDNVLVGTDGRARVTDFGLARVAGQSEGEHGGTPGYIAPERAGGAPPDARSDQFAFAVTAHEALHGQRPGRSPAAGFPIARALASDPTARYPSMRELLGDLATRPIARWRRWLALGCAIAIAGGLSVAAWSRRPETIAAEPEGMHTPCRGINGACPAPLVCRYAEGNLCGAADKPGRCGWRVDGCRPDANPACGCDGISYRSQCDAHDHSAATGYRGNCVACTPDVPCADVISQSKKAPAFCHVFDDGHGICWPRPSNCAPEHRPVCGRDGQTHENACEARRDGTDVLHPGACPP